MHIDDDKGTGVGGDNDGLLVDMGDARSRDHVARRVGRRGREREDEMWREGFYSKTNRLCCTNYSSSRLCRWKSGMGALPPNRLSLAGWCWCWSLGAALWTACVKLDTMSPFTQWLRHGVHAGACCIHSLLITACYTDVHASLLITCLLPWWCRAFTLSLPPGWMAVRKRQEIHRL